MAQVNLEQDKSYLIKVGTDINEFKCVKVTEQCYKLDKTVDPVVDNTSVVFNNNYAFYVLKTDVGDLISYTYNVIESL